MNPKSRKFGPRLTISLTGSDYATVNALAEKDDVSASWIVRRAIDEYLRRHRKEITLSVSTRGLRERRAPAAGRQQNRQTQQRGTEC
jgi:predicted transcriptional regulator